MRRWSATLGVALLLFVPSAALGADETARDALQRTLDVELADPAVNGSTGVYVWDVARQEALYAFHPSISRTLASNTKLFTSSAVLGTFGADGRLTTRALAGGPVGPDGVLDGDLYLVGMGDPTFGTAATIASRYDGVGAKVEDLLAGIEAAGVKRITGRVIGDASRFDDDRGPTNGESALTFNRGVHSNPGLWAAQQLTNELEARGIDVAGAASTGTAPQGATPVAAVESPTMAELLKLMNKPSDNFFAEMLVRNLAAAAGELGTTAAGSLRSETFAHGLGVAIDQVDGSGLDGGNSAAPASIVQLLDTMRTRPGFPAFFASLPIAGVDGTLEDRMRDTPAMHHCNAKTGSLGSSVSALSGYCRQPGGHLVLFSILMNRLSGLSAGRDAQDRMASAIASYSAATVDEVVDSVSASTPAGGRVPATLSLSLGEAPNLGTFVPGVARTYEAETTANAVSTAADATLTVADPDTTAPGRLVNTAAALPAPLEVRGGDGAWAPVGGTAAPTSLLRFEAPVSNDAVTIGFRQAISATTPLRTGRYEKTLRFTLSTSTP
ncbi:MAG TPA: D-alanyl-D-alanine carboxypeptidase/D-alanyl-D-alanine-endopeptidase [Solirubrobacter sp.]|nr:D-alanyl-D-alanine carboxypeptidase/D-alanyl-D-alanine-endopeptidase [Solirubrobacter sp.]